jgi:hypothetical protein
MEYFLGNRLPARVLKAWSKHFVTDPAPFFLSNDIRPYLNNQVILSKNEFHATLRDLSFHDSYTTYAVKPEASWVVLLSSQQVQDLPDDVRLELLKYQVEMGRGQLYNFDDYKSLLNKVELEQAQPYTFRYADKVILELSHNLWQGFSFATQKHWLKKVVSEDRVSCLSGTLSKSQWSAINADYPAIKSLLGFVDASGSNCFSTALAAILDRHTARIVSSLWLQSETFLRSITARGFKQSNVTVDSHIPTGSMLIWKKDRALQHGCFYIGDGLVFNKDAQGWFAPRQILGLETVLRNWQDDGLEVQVYTRG